ncbi:hypothetical protein BGW38_008429 [Lunasporangiospora selenospora]|uniref:CUE domain-containing protein n=1 Tax=Lunasporangiospora selenospora TaxID=979761 RepID=A0A9P6G318_9FUNG|nr:hypothetical protein BGW38_008429 [Lunasporangiospora selenospora]
MSFISTLLQYAIPFAIGLVCVKVFWSNRAQDIEGAQKQTSAPTSIASKLAKEPIQAYYPDQKKTLLSKNTSTLSAEKEDGLESLTEASENGDIEIMRTQEQQPQRQPHRDPTVLRKQSSQRSNSTTLTSVQTIATTETTQSPSPPVVHLFSKPATATTTKKTSGTKRSKSFVQEIQPAPSEEAATRRQFLAEMFKDVPMTEIDRVMRATHWDMDDATAVLAKEDYTWQSVVHRRRSVTSLEAAA